MQKIQDELRKLERRDWWLWGLAMIVMLLLTFAVFSISFPELHNIENSFFHFSFSMYESVRSLFLLILLFNTYTIYQQVAIKRLRRHFFEQLEEMRVLQVRSEEFHRLSIVDSLTGLYNRRFAEERLTSEASRSRRHGHPLAVVSLDLDKFKQINDTYGHPAGDQVLKEFAARLNTVIRLSDTASRMGGDEFLIILPECSANQVKMFLDRLGTIEVTWEQKKIPVSFSAGWVGYESGETTEQFLERADRTLYADKRAGNAALRQYPKEAAPVA